VAVGSHPTPAVEAPTRRVAEGAQVSPPDDPGPVLVPASARFEGLLTFRGRGTVEGEVEGEIVCWGTLHVGARGRVIGTVEADEVIVDGVLEGEATARNRLVLAATARVKGTVRAPRVHLAEGCVLEGRCETVRPAPG